MGKKKGKKPAKGKSAKSKKHAKKEKKAEVSVQPMQERRIKQIIRLAETNLDGEKPVRTAIRSIRGVSFMLSNAIASVTGFGDKNLGQLSGEEYKRLEDVIANPEKHNIPVWLLNRRADPMTGEDRHLTVSKLEFAHKMDINEMKKLKTYKGVRHAVGLTVRGQRTRSSFRRGSIVGVKRKKGKG